MGAVLSQFGRESGYHESPPPLTTLTPENGLNKGFAAYKRVASPAVPREGRYLDRAIGSRPARLHLTWIQR